MMIKKKSWLSKLKRFFFISETDSKPKKERKQKRLLKLPHINKLASIAPPLLPSSPQLVLHVEEKTQDEAENSHWKIQELAAIKIQTAFRGLLARKALRALKGLVRLQAIIRGRNVRRKAINTLKCLQSIVNIQRRVCERRNQSFDDINFEFHEKIESSNQRRWDDSILTQEEAKALFLNKKEAVIKRERAKEYALGHRNSMDHENGRANENLRSWLEEWVGKQLARRADHKDSNTLMSQTPSRSKNIGRKKLHYTTNHQKHRLEGLVSPKYMAPTESAKAKARSNSSPRTRTLSFDTYSEQNNSPYKNKLSDTSSVVTSERVSNSSGRMRSESDGFHCKSPSLKGVSGVVKSRKTAKDLSFDSECSLMNWDRYRLFR